MSAERLRADVFRLRRRKFAWAVPLLLVLAVFLVAALAFNLANLDTGGESIPQATAPGGSASRAGVFVPDPIATILLTVLSAFFLVGSVILLLRNRSSAKRPPKPFSWWAVLARALGMTLLILLLVGWPKAIQAARERVGTQTNATAADSGAFTTVWPAAAGWPVELFLIAAVLAALAWVVYLLRRSGRRPDLEWEAESSVPTERQAAFGAVRSTIRDLEGGGDVRTAILACFERFCALLGSRGITDQEALTPHELEGLAVDRLRVSGEASGILTSLFEEARYSEHPLGDRDRARAIDSLGQIQAALEA
jgi:hypothetical protein